MNRKKLQYLGPSALVLSPPIKEPPTAPHASVICLCVNEMRIFVCKLRLHFPDSKHLRCFVRHEIFGNFFVIRKFLAYTPPPPPQL
jgi:hypothetical protein